MVRLSERFEQAATQAADFLLRHAIKEMTEDELAELGRSEPPPEEFIAMCHEGYWQGQTLLLQELQRVQGERSTNKKALKKARRRRNTERQQEITRTNQVLQWEEAVLRRLADSLAWVLLGMRRWEIRRLWQAERPPTLSTSNVPSLEAVLDAIRPYDQQFALMTDLTSSIQIGDLIWVNHSSGQTTIAEVKEGSTNREIIEFMQSFQMTGCLRALQLFKNERTESEYKQFERIRRQEHRMTQAAHFRKNDMGIDPRTGDRLALSKEIQPLDTYEEELSSALMEALRIGQSSFVVDECLEVTAYRRDTLADHEFRVEIAHSAEHFLSDECLLDRLDPSEIDANLFDWSRLPSEPWELSRNLFAADLQPLFLMHVDPEALMAVAFGHLRVALVLNIPRWLELLEAQGLVVTLEEPTKRERASKRHKEMLLHDGKYIKATDGNFAIRFGTGYKARMTLEAAKPASLAEMIASTEIAPSPERTQR